ncbi:MAG: TIGR02281 family clan AA aspartic protease [Candidatus Pelagadaptatus aseana]|uniref:retropepsin-like aspartic protease family protein n=1 Tax=Candidatus Pelagadaptatus aseana TaxID=3120508 RepID=UPI0039B27BE0
MCWLKSLLILAISLGASLAQGADVEVKGLFKGSAILVVDGKQKLLKAGQSFAGVTLVSSNSKAAVVEIDGERHKLGMSRKISSTYKAAEKVEVRLAQVRGGHYITKGRINNRAVTMMVDTGATSVAMSLPQAKALGLDYRNGTPIRINTANGVSQGYKINLRSVQVGAVRVDNVEAVVNMSDFPDIILLGNSYLSRVSMSKQNGVLILQSKL